MPKGATTVHFYERQKGASDEVLRPCERLEWAQVRPLLKYAAKGQQIPKETEYALIRAAQQGDAEAREKLILWNMRLVFAIAKGRLPDPPPASVSFLDLIQAGSIGLMTAIDKFDLQKNVRLATYASWWIQQAIKRCISSKESCSYSLEAIQEDFGMLPADLAPPPSSEEELSELEMFSPKIRAAILRLTPRQQQIILLHFCHGMSLTAIAEQLHVRLQNCCEVMRDALIRLRIQLSSQ